jgi:hypothetical protein
LLDVRRKLFVGLFILVAGLIALPAGAAYLPRMRPYTGIGVVVFTSSDSGEQGSGLLLYDEPGLVRVGILNTLRLPGNEWVFGGSGMPPLVVSARKGHWLRVYYDDAGREAWIDPQSKGQYQTWEQYLKHQVCSMLPGLQPQYYQLLEQPGGKRLDTLSPKQTFRVLRLENMWAAVLIEQEKIGWVRWHEDDGRLLMGTGKK